MCQIYTFYFNKFELNTKQTISTTFPPRSWHPTNALSTFANWAPASFRITRWSWIFMVGTENPFANKLDYSFGCTSYETKYMYTHLCSILVCSHVAASYSPCRVLSVKGFKLDLSQISKLTRTQILLYHSLCGIRRIFGQYLPYLYTLPACYVKSYWRHVYADRKFGDWTKMHHKLMDLLLL